MKRTVGKRELVLLMGILAVGLGRIRVEAQPGMERPTTAETYLRTVELESHRNACSRVWENIYSVQSFDAAVRSARLGPGFSNSLRFPGRSRRPAR